MNRDLKCIKSPFSLLASRSPVQLPPVMALYAPYSLSEAVSTPVLVVGMAVFMFVEDDTRCISRNIGGMKIPVMPRVSALNGYVIIIHRDNIEIPRIY